MLLQEANELVAHIPDENLDLVSYQMCSQHVLDVMFDKLEDDVESAMVMAMRRMASSPMAAGVVGQMFELYLLRIFLPKGGRVAVAQFDKGEQNLSEAHHVAPSILGLVHESLNSTGHGRMGVSSAVGNASDTCMQVMA